MREGKVLCLVFPPNPTRAACLPTLDITLWMPKGAGWGSSGTQHKPRKYTKVMGTRD